MLKTIKDEFIKGMNKIDWIWLLLGLMLQIFGIIMGFKTDNPDNIITIIAGISGIVAIIYATKGKICNFVFSFIQIFCYMFGFTIPNSLHGQTFKNMIYVLLNIIAIYFWLKSYDFNKKQIKAKHLSITKGIMLIILFIFGVVVYGLFLSKVVLFGSLDSDPWIDSLTSIPAYIAQILSILGYSDQWIYWFILDVFGIILTWRAGSMVLVAQFIFYTVNCIKGWSEWRKTVKNDI